MTFITIRLGIRTKAALDIFAAKESIKTGHALTNDQAIMRLLEIVDKDVVDLVTKTQSEISKNEPG